MAYQLEKYTTNQASRHICPNCGDKHSFTYYVDDDGIILDERVGRCNHESSCGYHYTPRQYFQDHPDMNFDKCLSSNNSVTSRRDTPDFISFDMLAATMRNIGKNDLIYFIWNLFDAGKESWEKTVVCSLVNEYAVGTYRNGEAVFWQIDINGNVRTGKVMKYGTDGHRVKTEGGINWVHSLMKRKGLIPDDFNLVQCLFGEHLLMKYQNKKVALVESEKTALLGAARFNDFVWVATGGKNSSIIEKCKVLKGRDVVAFPDVDGFADWMEKSKLLTFCKSVQVIDIRRNVGQRLDAVAKLAKVADPNKIDIGDWIIYDTWTSRYQRIEPQEISNNEILKVMTRYNPNIETLINALNLKA